MTIKNIYWSRNIGEFVNAQTGEVTLSQGLRPLSMEQEEWNHTLTEIIGDYIRLTKILTSPDVLSILETTVLYRPVYNQNNTAEDIFLGPAKLVGEIHGKEVWIDEQMDCNILHMFYSKDDFDKERVSIHILGLNIY